MAQCIRTRTERRQQGQDVHIGFATTCIYNLFSTIVQRSERARWTQRVCRVRQNKHALVAVEDEIRVACRSCGGRAAANAHLPWGTTAAAAPAVPGTSGTAAPASAPTGPPPAAPPPPEKKKSMPGISHQKEPKHAKITPSASGTVGVGIVSQSLPASNMHRKSAMRGTRQRVIA